ncbi:GvpL/GvpF family gas vesicle protein [Streptomyces roseicoloratus]|uniref:GvpL/GvpF family gas vesicle protein n=1 Tax=Streptomyces roseicoloratus TaxID=2508722 RepID=A0ABY9S2N9_9ACTN|nr:GvpL/GvpF family gas vesicle protein [Streptomyces roseicoloratus]WMX48701.1 GvpL/GvpF family gas vesicle protein [Streptomyces roseicoloratus]
MALYVYAVTKSSHPLGVDELEGVGGDGTPVRAVRGDGLCAVVSEAPAEITMTRPDLEAHHAVQERLWNDGPTLPLSFGFVAEDEDAVRAVLDAEAEQFAERLDELADRVEFNVKGVQEEEAILRRILADSEPVRQLNEATRDGGGTYDQRLELGRLLNDEVLARQTALAESVLAALRPHAHAERLGEPSQQYFLSASFLVDRQGVEEFTRAAEEASGELPEGVEVRVRGPLPPYSFT